MEPINRAEREADIFAQTYELAAAPDRETVEMLVEQLEGCRKLLDYMAPKHGNPLPTIIRNEIIKRLETVDAALAKARRDG